MITLNGRVSWPFFVLAAIVVVALALRIHGIDWDGGYAYHPDERDIYMRSDCMYALLTDSPHASTCGYLNDHPEAEPGLGGLRYFFDAERSPLNPHWFPLGSILIYLMVFIRSVVELFTDVGGLDMRYAGRALSALADVGSVLMVFLLGRRMYGRNVGLLAAGLTALAVVHVQHSHFYRPETFTVLLTLASIWATLRMVEKRRLRDSVLLGVILGLALAPKVNVLPLLAPLALGYGYRVLDEAEGKWDEITPEMLQKVAGHAILAGMVAIAVFFVTTPYAFIDIGAFVSDVMLQTRMARNAGMFPFTVQYVDTPAFLYQMRQTIVWGLGVPLGVVAWLAIPFTALLVFLERRHFRADLILLAWVAPSLLFLESFEVRFLRYLFPLMPVMILLASRMMLWNLERAGDPARRLKDAARETFAGIRRRRLNLPAANSALVMALIIGLPVIVVASTVFYSLAFQRVYANEHPATQASRWILTEVPRGTGIVFDNHWDEFLPGIYGYDTWQFPLYERDSQGKMTELASNLARSDYLVFYSARPYASAARDPERFPYSNSYYRQLFAGELGYRLHREFTNYPSLGGVVFRDDALRYSGLHSPVPELTAQGANFTLNFGYADDNVSGYDHPRVLVFRNALRLDEQTLRSKLAPPVRPASADDETALMLTPEALEKQQFGRHVFRHRRPARLAQRSAGTGLAAGGGADIPAHAAPGLLRFPPAVRRGVPVGANPGAACRLLGGLDCGLAGVARLFPRSGVPGHGSRRRPVRGCAVVQAPGNVGIRPVAMAVPALLRGAVFGGVPRFRRHPLPQPGLVAPVPGRREADGAGLLYGGFPVDDAAAFRPVVCGGLPELLLLGLFRHRLRQPGGRRPSNYGLQPGRAALLRLDRHRRLLAGVQPGRRGEESGD